MTTKPAAPKRRYRTKAVRAAEAAAAAEAEVKITADVKVEEARAAEAIAAEEARYAHVYWEADVNANLSNLLVDAGRHARCPQCGAEYEILEVPIVEGITGATDRKFFVRYFKYEKMNYYVSVFGRKEDAGCPRCLDSSKAYAKAEAPTWEEDTADAHLARRLIQASGTGWGITRWQFYVTEQPLLTLDVRPYGGAIRYIPVANMMAHVFPDAEYAGRSEQIAVYMYWTHCKAVRLRVFDREADVLQSVIHV